MKQSFIKLNDLNPSNSKGFELRPWIMAILITCATLLIYLPVLHNDFIWDDDDYVTENPTLRNLQGLKDIWFKLGAVPQYYPMVHTSFWLEYHLWQLNPAGYHLVNVLIHAMNAFLVWRILLRLGIPGSWLPAMLFALHPVHVESVAWVTERKNVLSGLFYLMALWKYLQFQGFIPDGKPPSRLLWPSYLTSLAFYTCALLSKTVTCSLPVILLLIFWWKRRLNSSIFVQLIPFFVVGVSLGLVTVWMERNMVGAQGYEWALSLLDRCIIAGHALWFYIWKLLWPANLTFIYPRWNIDSANVWQYFFPISFIACLAILLTLQRRAGRGPLVALLYFAVSLFPALGFFDVYPMRFSFVADHFQYLASLGILILCSTCFVRLELLFRKGKPLIVKGISAIPMLCLLGILTWNQSRIYKDPQVLWQDTIRKNPNAWIAHNNLGLYLYSRNETEKAIYHFQESIRLKPDDPGMHLNLALALARSGELSQAAVHFQTCLRLNPREVGAHYNYALYLLNTHQMAAAITHLRNAVELNPNHLKANQKLGKILFDRGEFNEAMPFLRKTYSLASESIEDLLRLSWILSSAPQDSLRNGKEAVSLAQEICQNTSFQNIQALDALAAGLAEMKEFSEAQMIASNALEIAMLLQDTELRQKIGDRLKLYQSGQPFRLKFPEKEL